MKIESKIVDIVELKLKANENISTHVLFLNTVSISYNVVQMSMVYNCWKGVELIVITSYFDSVKKFDFETRLSQN